MIAGLRKTKPYQAIKRTKLYHAFRGSRLYDEADHWRQLLRDPEYRARDRVARAEFVKFFREQGGVALREDLLLRNSKPKTALILSQAYLPYAKLEAVVMKAMQMAGCDTVVCGNRRYDFLRYGWLAGNHDVVELSDFPTPDPSKWVDEQMGRLSSLRDWLDLTLDGVHVGRFVTASVLRSRQVGRLDFASPEVQRMMRFALRKSAGYTFSGAAMLESLKPDVVLMMDRGYSGYGEIFDVAVTRGIDTLIWQLGYKSNRLVFKRYNLDNSREHPLNPSEDSWKRLRSLPWKADYTQQLRQELFQCYDSQDWFSTSGNQFDKKIHSKESTRQKLGLSGDKKVAVIFAHILWDASFFYGEDLFDDYTELFVETVRAAIRNPKLHWLVKIHPAHIVKAKQGNHKGRPAELEVIDEVFGHLPPHVTLIYPSTDVSTYSLFEIADYTLTVRGTVGIESALFGIPVVTAGTGRYDRRGFTIDSSSREDYLQKLAVLETLPRLSEGQVRLAERYAYGVFFWRPLSLSCVSLEYERDDKASPKLMVRCRSREDWFTSPDMRRLADFIADGKTEDMAVPES